MNYGVYSLHLHFFFFIKKIVSRKYAIFDQHDFLTFLILQFRYYHFVICPIEREFHISNISIDNVCDNFAREVRNLKEHREIGKDT